MMNLKQRSQNPSSKSKNKLLQISNHCLLQTNHKYKSRLVDSVGSTTQQLFNQM